MSSKIHLTIATPLYPPDIGGPATYTKLLESELPQYDIVVEVVSFTESRHLPKGISHMHFAWRLWKSTRQADVVLAQDPVSVGLPSAIVAKIRKCHFVIRMPGDYAWEQSRQRYGVTDTIDDFQNKKYGRRVERLRSIQRWVSKQADKIIAPSDYFTQLVRGWGVEASRVVTIYNGIALPGEELMQKSSTTKTIISAGRLVPWKGMKGLIELMQSLPDWRLRIAGDGTERSTLETLVKKLNLEDRITFLGQVPRSELLKECREADVFVLNTSFESFSFQVVEVMSLGTPVITTNIGSLPELITDGVEGILVDPEDKEAIISAIQSIKTSPEIWHNRTAQAKIKAQKFTIEQTTRALVELLKNISKI